MSGSHPWFDQIQFALYAVASAVRLAKTIQQDMKAGEEMTKNDRSPVTVADFAVQALVGQLLAGMFPDERFVAEESSAALRNTDNPAVLQKVLRYVREFVPHADEHKVCDWIDRGTAQPIDRFWVLDPIDGTTGFLRGDQYVVALALIVDGEVRLGVLGCPNLTRGSELNVGGEGSIVLAEKGKGCWYTDLELKSSWKPMKVSSVASPEQARLLRSVEANHSNVTRTQKMVELMKSTAPSAAVDSQAKYAVLAGGRAEFFCYLPASGAGGPHMRIWDVAPGAIIVEEAGGRITDMEGKDLDFTAGLRLAKNPGIVVSNGCLHEAVLSAIRQTA